MHAVGAGGGEDEVKQRGLVDLGDLGAAVVLLVVGGGKGKRERGRGSRSRRDRMPSLFIVAAFISLFLLLSDAFPQFDPRDVVSASNALSLCEKVAVFRLNERARVLDKS